MIEQFQTKFSDKDKNTFANSILTTYACFLNINLSDCPDYEDINADEIVEWIENEFGYEENHYSSDPFIDGFVSGEDYYFAWGISGRENEHTYHQVIYNKGRLYHDPFHDPSDPHNPRKNNIGLTQVNGFIVLEKIDQGEILKEGHKMNKEEMEQIEEKNDISSQEKSGQFLLKKESSSLPQKENNPGSIQLNIGNVIDQSVEKGLQEGINRLYQKTSQSSRDNLKDELKKEVMKELNKIINF